MLLLFLSSQESLGRNSNPQAFSGIEFQGDTVYNAVKKNVKRGVVQVKSAAPILSEKVNAGQLQVVGGYYDLDTGGVILLD